jgi:hypothetical protein
MGTTAPKHVCGLCKAGFADEAKYVAHVCKETGVTPADAEHQGEAFKAVQTAALKRGAEKKK